MECRNCRDTDAQWLCLACNGTGKQGKWVRMHNQTVWVTICKPASAIGHIYQTTMTEIDERLRQPILGGVRVMPSDRY